MTTFPASIVLTFNFTFGPKGQALMVNVGLWAIPAKKYIL